MGVETIILGGAALLKGASAIAEGNAKEDAAKRNAKVADDNAAIAREQAAIEEKNFRVGAQKQLGDIRASTGASGLDFGGSASDVLFESARTAEADALNIRRKGEIRAKGYQTEAENQRVAGRQARTSGYLSAAGSAIDYGASFVKGK